MIACAPLVEKALVEKDSAAHAPAPFSETAGHSPIYNPVREYLPAVDPANTEFVILSFEGPDPYSRAGGLGVRVTELSRALATRGFETHLYFVGDPHRPHTERLPDSPLHLHRWSQWISRHHPRGVYDGENGKLHDFQATIPHHLLHERVLPTLRRGKRVVVLSEEWHTAHTACVVSDALWGAGVRDETVLMWNANNTMGFHHVDFARLRHTQTLSTVSRWMKHEMWSWGCNPIVVPNGIPGRRLDQSDLVDELAAMAQAVMQDRLTVGKVARFDPDKRWLMAVDAVANLKRMGLPVLFIARGGLEEHGHAVLGRAHSLGLRVRNIRCDSRDPREAMRALLREAPGADMLNVEFHLTEPLSRALFKVADVMLQNSGREPFGLVGLEVMAAGGLVFTGATGEEYARPYDNAVVLDTDDPHEISTTVAALLSRPDEVGAMRRKAVETARQYTWDHVLDILLRRVQYLAAGK
jgi:glycosyltransferase involved in cell wall biosynthesis